MIFRDETITEEIEEKAQILVDALPYIRDFNQKIIVICFEGSNLLSEEEEKELMRDVALLKSIGMKPVVVHDSKMGHDKFRENKMVAKMIELSGIKAVGICGIDIQTILMNVDNDYIPVITPNDIDNEDVPVSPADCAAQIAKAVKAEKLVFLSETDGIRDMNGEKVGQIMYSDFKKLLSEKGDEGTDGRQAEREKFAADFLESGGPRVHFIDARTKHGILLELFSIKGVGTAVLSDGGNYYPHELSHGKLITE